MRIDTERKVAKDLWPQSIAQAHILETDHPPLSDKLPVKAAESLPRRGPPEKSTSSPHPASGTALSYKIMTTLP